MDGGEDTSRITRRLSQEDPWRDAEGSTGLLHARYAGDSLCQDAQLMLMAVLNRGKERGDAGAQETGFDGM